MADKIDIKKRDFENVDRGNIVLIDFNPQSGKEIMGNRYALILSTKLFNASTGFVSVCPITNTKRGFGFEVDIPNSEVHINHEDNEFCLTGVILTHQLKNLDARSRRLKIVGIMPDRVVEECINYINTYLS